MFRMNCRRWNARHVVTQNIVKHTLLNRCRGLAVPHTPTLRCAEPASKEMVEIFVINYRMQHRIKISWLYRCVCSFAVFRRRYPLSDANRLSQSFHLPEILVLVYIHVIAFVLTKYLRCLLLVYSESVRVRVYVNRLPKQRIDRFACDRALFPVCHCHRHSVLPQMLPPNPFVHLDANVQFDWSAARLSCASSIIHQKAEITNWMTEIPREVNQCVLGE